MAVHVLQVKRVITCTYQIEVDDATQNQDTVRLGEQNLGLSDALDLINTRHDSGPHDDFIDDWNDPDLTEISGFAYARYIS